MTTQNIGIVFGPTLMRPERDNGNMAVNMVYQNQAVELILSEFDHIFGMRGPSWSLRTDDGGGGVSKSSYRSDESTSSAASTHVV